MLSDWLIWARPDQLPPPGDWVTWLVLGGRGAGKTRAGAEWVQGVAAGNPPYSNVPVGRIALIGETYAEAREVMVEGVSGLLNIGGADTKPSWQPSRRRLEWPNGAVAQLFSATDPESLRGPQFGAAWCDELAKWPHAEATWDMLQFGLRLGERPQQVVTTTPRAVPLMRQLLADPRVAVSRMRTADNAGFLAPSFLRTIVDKYQGTRLGRQELDGDLIEDRDDALWSRADLDRGRVMEAPELGRIVVAVDPPATSGVRSAACGIVAVGLGKDGRGYVIADATIEQASPLVWADRAVSLFHAVEADLVVAEVNQGGEMVETVLREADATVPVKAVRASRGKWSRAEPVALLYSQERVVHLGTHAALEDQMCNFAPSGTPDGASPDRIDALVWALTELMLQPQPKPRVRKVR
ncbi:MAG: terminase family protein [Pseudomonadota bacterium]